MRNFIIFLLVIATLNAFEKGKLEIVWYKVTNGSYEVSLPHYESTEINGYFVRTKELDLLFTAPRGDWSSLDHKAIKYSNSYGLCNRDFYITFSIDILQNLTEDYDIEFGNTLKVGYWW